MKKFIALGLASFALAPLAHAHEYSPKEILAALIENAGRVEVVDDSGKRLESLATILAGALAVDTSVPEGQPAVINSLQGSCEEMDQGSASYGCGLQVIYSDYVATKDGFRGPDAEREFFLTFKAKKQANGKLRIQGPVNYTKAI